jgi:hypothetical protein
MKKAGALLVFIPAALLVLAVAGQSQDAPEPGQPAAPAPPGGEEKKAEGEAQPAPAPGKEGEVQPAPAPGKEGEAQPAPAPGKEGEVQPAPAPGKEGEMQPAPGGEGEKKAEPAPAAPAADAEPAPESDGMPKFPGRTSLTGMPALDAATEKHEAVLGENGRASVFLADESRARVAGTAEGTRFGFYAALPDRPGYSAFRLDTGSMELHLGLNPLRVWLPQGEVAFEGMGTQALVSIGGISTTISRPGGESGKMSVFLDGRTLEVPPGGTLELTAQGLSTDSVEGAPSEPRAPEKTSETFNYVSGTSGSFEITLPGNSRINGGDLSDLMLTANRVPDTQFFLGEMRDGAFNVNANEATTLLLETPSHRLSFAPVLPQEPASGESPAGTPPGEGTPPPEKKEEPGTPPEKKEGAEPGEEPGKAPGGEGSARPGIPGPRRSWAGGPVSTAQAASGNEIWVAIKGDLEFVRHSQGGALTMNSKVVTGFGVVLSVGGGASLITLKDQGRVLVDAFEAEQNAQPVKIIIGGRVFILPPTAKAKVEATPRHPEEEGEIVLKAGALDVMVYGMGHPLSCRFVISERVGAFRVTPSTAFEDPGSVRTTPEASPFLPN